ncbi:biotin synthase BioB, partial [Streptomyces rhizosphaericola]
QAGGCGSHEASGGGGCGSHAGGGGCGPCGGHAAVADDEEGAPATETAGAPAAPAGGPARTDLVAVRRRGAGTDLAPNA